MSISPIITFKAGLCTLDTSVTPNAVKANSTPGYIYLYSEDELVHFCWRPRSAPLTEPELDLVMVPSDGTFTPYKPTSAHHPSNPDKPTNGRIYVLKFSSSSQRYLFWLQSRSQHEQGNSAWFSARDLKLGQIVNTLLQGEEIDVQSAINNLPKDDSGNGAGDDDDDETMEDVEGTDHSPDRQRGSGSRGAGPGATGGDVREEGQGSREGGADGGRAVAPCDPSIVVQELLRSLQGTGDQPEAPFTTLTDLLPPSTTLPLIETADLSYLDHLLKFLPLPLLINSQDVNTGMNHTELQILLDNISAGQKREILRRVLHSPQFMQSLGSLTMALQDGGLPTISDALNIQVKNGGFLRRGGVPLGGGDAVRVFLEGIQQLIETENENGKMETD
ncbi:hypothetical protein FQN57_002497 [Myotisia sp. PD_48]|nr:hypothetical protein FQN57_002497 [Myotisia sp. PD_48]